MAARVALAGLVGATAVVAVEVSTPDFAGASTGEACPAGSVANEFYWQRADGTGARWPGAGLDPATSAQNTGFALTYPVGASGVTLTASITDPDNINEDGDSPFVPNSSVAPNPPNIGNWDTPLYTKTNGAYGLDYLTIVEGSANSDQTLRFDFSFSKPVLIPEFDIGDIDYRRLADVHDHAATCCTTASRTRSNSSPSATATTSFSTSCCPARPAPPSPEHRPSPADRTS